MGGGEKGKNDVLEEREEMKSQERLEPLQSFFQASNPLGAESRLQRSAQIPETAAGRRRIHAQAVHHVQELAAHVLAVRRNLLDRGDVRPDRLGVCIRCGTCRRALSIGWRRPGFNVGEREFGGEGVQPRVHGFELEAVRGGARSRARDLGRGAEQLQAKVHKLHDAAGKTQSRQRVHCGCSRGGRPRRGHDIRAYSKTAATAASP